MHDCEICAVLVALFYGLAEGVLYCQKKEKRKKKMQIPQHKMLAVQFSFFSGFKSNKEVLFVFLKQVIKCNDKNSMISCDGWISQS